MPTEQSTHGADGLETPPASQDDQNAPAPSEQSQFDARKAFDATNRRVNDIAETLSKIPPEVIAELAKQYGGKEQKQEAQTPQAPDVSAVVKQQLWLDRNDDRISQANADGKYDSYVKQGLIPDLALRLAEQDMGIKVDTSAQTRQSQVSSAPSSVDRGSAPAMPESLKGLMTPEEFAKIAPDAARVQVIR